MSLGNCCAPVIVQVIKPQCEEPVTITLQSSNLTGVSILESWTGTVGTFVGVGSANSMLTVSLDAVNHVALFTLNANAIAAALPAATTTQVGVLETSTDAEAQAKSAVDKTLTPSNLAALGSTASFAGLIEIATLAELVTGTATDLAVVPSTLAGRVFLSLADTSNTTMAAAATATVTQNTGATIVFTGDASGTLLVDQTTLQVNTKLELAGAQISNGGTVNNGVLSTDGSGLFNINNISDFLSTFNVQAGYTPVTNGAVFRTYDCNTITLPQLAQALGTLIADLRLVKLPAT